MVIVNVSQGFLDGEAVENPYGGTYFSFKGIPYAEPPVGDLRFKAPIPPKSWEGIFSAKEFGPVCFQFNALTQQYEGSEDCLYLNIYTPDLQPINALPVMFYIHGGAFTRGSGNDNRYGPEFLVRHDVILVTINYRLEVLGFLSLGTEEIPGNAGMKDQVAALRWVKNNIRNFGGDPENITIFGESAGGACVSYHLISPMSKGLFKRAIVQSGSANNSWAQSTEPRERALKIARHLGLHSNDNKKIYEYFKTAPLEWLTHQILPITVKENIKEALQLYFSITSEEKFGDNERFFYGDVNDAIRNNVHEDVEIIIGYTVDEGVFGFIGLDIEKVINQINTCVDFLTPDHIVRNCTLKEQIEVGKKLKEFYFEHEIASQQNYKKLFKYYTLHLFAFDIMEYAKILSKKNKVYFYTFSCKSERNIFTTLMNLNTLVNSEVVVCHGDDLPYIFPFKKEVNMTSESFKLIDNVTKLWTNFAQYGNPTPDDSVTSVIWTPYDAKKQAFLDLGNELKIDTEPNKQDLDFWEEIYRQYLPNHIYSDN